LPGKLDEEVAIFSRFDRRNMNLRHSLSPYQIASGRAVASPSNDLDILAC
jgi:hypothetical protein